ncbi:MULTISPECIES: hypothetical protein [Streptomyces]|uniref:hypothetical protein n=1 Tax=Streptomyces TaxID=1883 RepID=UPI00163C0C6D|nr:MULTISPECIES: hypothetical protein [Streptomyces]MBC2876781.1 hypothetical protein [Streptomyces sp. TYQ1024]UBI36405.1 hypothetical protein K7I03_07955 [Streptomyces mobaraensis]
MPLIPEEPQIHESVPGPRAVPAAGRTASTPRPVPGPRPAPRPGPRAARPVPAPPGPRTPPPAAPAAPQVQLIPVPAEGALDAADEAVDLLLDSGRAPGDVLVLTTGEAHPWAAHELSFGEASYWAQHDAADDVFYADAGADRVKGRPVVVVAVNGGSDAAVRQALPAALGRAGALLVVCGDSARVNSVLSAAV